MGVPKFAAWLTKKYPTMVTRTCPPAVHGLYVDLNGLIHPCCHDEDDPSVALRPEPEKLRQICLAIETLVVTVRPQHVIYIAVDGVAPRAKMNQQRARRYMSAAEPISQRGGGALVALEAEFSHEQRAAAEEELNCVAKDLNADALYGGDDESADAAAPTAAVLLPDPDALIDDLLHAKPALHPSGGRRLSTGAGADGGNFDGNCISPGTEFMAKVSVAVRSFLEERMAAADALWAGPTVIFSDANTPGEGEHKLIDFIRTQSTYAGFNGHGAHVIAGLDADLIFLSLSLHIPHVYILRDNKRPSTFDRKAQKRTARQGQRGARRASASSSASDAVESSGAEDGDDDRGHARGDSTRGLPSDSATKVEACTTYEFYDIDVVGSSLVSEIYLLCQMKGFVMKADVRAHTGGELIAGNGYCFDRVAGRPDGGKKTRWPGQGRAQDIASFHPCTATCNSKLIDDFIVMAMIMGNDFLPRVPSAFCGESTMDNILEVYTSFVLPYGYLTLGNHEIDLEQLTRFFEAYAQIEAVKFRQFCIKQDKMTAAESASPIDSDVDDRWRQPYYASTTVTLATREDACRKYIEGLRFVWRYYSSTSTQVSWSWFYPFHHGPFAFDLFQFLRAQGPHVQQALPPAPLEAAAPDIFAQQLCILPPTSKALVPEIFRRFMTKPPEDLQDTFPREWLVDFTASYNKEHLATVMLPFANMDRLKLLVREFASHLTDAERERQQSNDFHLVLRRMPATPEDNGETGAEDRGEYAFEVKGRGLAPLAATKVPSSWQLRTDCAALKYYQLHETQPDRCRPRTYSYGVPIFNLTTAADGKVVQLNRKALKQAEEERRHATGRARAQSSKRGEGDAGEGAITMGRAVAMSTTSFAEFATCACGVALLVLLATTAVGEVAVKVQAVGLLAAVLLVAFTVGFGVGAAGSCRGSGIHRNSIRMTFVDWQCGQCLCLNFSRNNRCFVCAAPFDEHRDWALFSGKNPPELPLMDPDHSQYMERFGRVES